MEQLVSELAERFGISNEQAMEAVTMVVGYIKDQLPAPIAAQVDGVLGGNIPAGVADQAQQMLGNLGGMFGKQ